MKTVRAKPNRKRPRVYESRLREQQMGLTRARLIEAASELMLTQQMAEVSLARVARHAGISPPTAYRYFPTPESLLTAMVEWAENRLRVDEPPDDPRQLPDYVRTLFAAYENNVALLHAQLSTELGRATYARGEPLRATAVAKSMRALTHKLPAAAARRAAAVVRALVSADSWQTMQKSYELDRGEAGRAAAWALSVLLAELERNPRSVDNFDSR
jgi:AcrR family transcriptional regulator